MERRRRGLGGKAAACVAAGMAVALAGAAAAQTGIKVESIEQVGGWDRVVIQGSTLFVTATPNSRAARAYCIAGYLRVAYDDIPSLDPKAEPNKIGNARGYGCVLLHCIPDAADRKENEVGVVIVAHAPPAAERRRATTGFSLRLGNTPGERGIVLFDRAGPDALALNGALKLEDWSVGDRLLGTNGNYVRVQARLRASYAFLERLAARPAAALAIAGEDRQVPDLRSGAQTLALSLARTADVSAELRRLCPTVRWR